MRALGPELNRDKSTAQLPLLQTGLGGSAVWRGDGFDAGVPVAADGAVRQRQSAGIDGAWRGGPYGTCDPKRCVAPLRTALFVLAAIITGALIMDRAVLRAVNARSSGGSGAPSSKPAPQPAA
ncbi:hypothetical protein SAMN04488527_14116 [Aliiroseovarius crassostreae]|nr:hypothetical protein SAMN04488527_14116 [Aliiroseovarius crassostreae]